MKYLFDTNICIYIIKKKPAKVIDKFLSLKINDVGISTITLSELWYGVYKSSFPEKNAIALNQFLIDLQIVSYDYSACEVYGKIRSGLEKKGKTIGSMDILISAVALANNLTLVTNNTKEFNRIKELKVENWVYL